MKTSLRIRDARRHGGFSQSQLAAAVGVRRSAVSHWESSLDKNPSFGNLVRIAEVTSVHLEWLATGRGAMALSREEQFESIPVAHALLVDDALEMRMINTMRAIGLKSALLLVELGEQLEAFRTGSARRGRLVKPQR